MKILEKISKWVINTAKKEEVHYESIYHFYVLFHKIDVYLIIQNASLVF